MSKKKNVTALVILFLMAIILSACGNSTNEHNEANNNAEHEAANEANNNGLNKNDSADENNETEKHHNNNDSNQTSNEAANQQENTEENSSYTEESEALSEYSSEEIEYARVWLEVIGNKDIERLDVSHRAKGEAVNQYDEDSVDYPEDVIYLGADVTAKGGAVYSGNGDGTINVYDVPSHWPSAEQIDESMEEYTQDIVDHPEKVEIDSGDDAEVEELIKKLNIESNGEEQTEDEELKEDEAVENVLDYVEEHEDYDDVSAMVDGGKEGEFNVRIFENHSDHIATLGWYMVNKETGEVEAMEE